MHQANNGEKLPKSRIFDFDFFRGLILVYMSFVNLYYALSKKQVYLLSHHGKLMSGGDLIIIYFFFMIGFNLPLVSKFKKISFGKLLRYVMVRGILLIAIGIILVSYQFIFYGFVWYVALKSFLFILGWGLVVTGILSRFLQFRKRFIWGFALLFTVEMILYPILLPPRYSYLTPYFILTAVWGYYLAILYLEDRDKFMRFSRLFVSLSLIAGSVYLTLTKSIPSRQTLTPSYFLISWGLLWGLFLLFLRYNIYERFFQKQLWLLRSGSHPLSFWIIHSLVIAISVMLATLYRYWQEDTLVFFWSLPYQWRVLENHSLAIFLSVFITILTVLFHLLYIRRFGKKKYDG